MSQVTDPIILDSTGQLILTKLQAIAHALGGVSLYTQSEWDALSTAEKQSHGLVAIQRNNSGYQQGILVNGADYQDFSIKQSGVARNSTTFTVTDGGLYILYVIALNSEASSYQLNINVTQNTSNILTGETLEYVGYSSSGTNRRNHRLMVFELNANANDSIDISLSNYSNYTMFAYALCQSAHTILNKSLTSVDSACSGSNNISCAMLYGVFNGSAHTGTINGELYTADITFTTANPGNSYCSGYIFWLRTPTQFSSLLINSITSNICAEALCECFTPGDRSWGHLTTVGAESMEIQEDSSVHFNGNTMSAFYDLGDSNQKVTVYMVFKSLTSDSFTRLISNVYSNNSGNSPGFYRNGTNIYYTYYSGDTNTGVSAIDGYHCIACSHDRNPNTSTFFVDGVKKGTLSPSNIGRYVEFSATLKAGQSQYYYGGNYNIKYMAVVKGAESESTIIANMQNIMAHYGIN